MNAFKPSSLLLVSTVFLTPLNTTAAERWYNPDQVQQGHVLFLQNCASCHGNQAQGLSDDWKKVGPDGKYPAPPLNGTAHTWHHPLTLLRKTVRDGGTKLGGSMPGFNGTLNVTETDAIIAWFQSHWPDQTYSNWLTRNGLKGSQYETTQAKEPSKPDLLQGLRKRLPDAKIGTPKATPINNILSVRTGNSRVYLSDDGRYAFIGDLIDLHKGVNLSEQQRRLERITMLESFPVNERIVFSAPGKEKAAIMIFTDTSCPYCRQQHAELTSLHKSGISVHYLPFPRNGKAGKGYLGLRAVWCAVDRKQALHTTKQSDSLANPATVPGCASAHLVDKGYRLGKAMNVRGTPAILLPNGKLINGFRSAQALIKELGL